MYVKLRVQVDIKRWLKLITNVKQVLLEDWSLRGDCREVLDSRSLETQKEGRCGILLFSKRQCSFFFLGGGDWEAERQSGCPE